MISTKRTTKPERRPLKIYAFDPMLGRVPENRISIEVPNEPLRPGPVGNRLQVVDYNATYDCYYEPVDLDDPHLLMQGGLDPSEADPRFHQQMVYAVASKVIEHFDLALGRRFRFRRNKRLRLFPHAFEGQNAFYDRGLEAVLFGYFRADGRSPGPNLPGQAVFTCLSHDVIAHEVTHAIVDRLREHFMEPTNDDVAAFHEGFADIVAIFQHFTFPNVLRDHVQKIRGDIANPSPLIDLAEQFGYATGQGKALRTAINQPMSDNYQTLTEPHERGSLLVASVFDAFFANYQTRVRDLTRVATGGSGLLPQGDIHPDLAKLFAKEASRSASSLLNMCIRAFDYLPPVDITYGDYLRALITADFELSPSDEFGQRNALIEGFRRRGIYPENVFSLAEESLKCDIAEVPLRTRKLEVGKAIAGLVLKEVADWRRLLEASSSSSDNIEAVHFDDFEELEPRKEGDDYEWVKHDLAEDLRKYAWDNAEYLNLNRDLKIRVAGFHPTFRISPHGQLLVELVAQFVQTRPNADSNSVPFRGGTTLIFSADGEPRYVISKPITGSSATLSQRAQEYADFRYDRQQNFLKRHLYRNPASRWVDDATLQRNLRPHLHFSKLNVAGKRKHSWR